jgi:hypothetical protein
MMLSGMKIRILKNFFLRPPPLAEPAPHIYIYFFIMRPERSQVKKPEKKSYLKRLNFTSTKHKHQNSRISKLNYFQKKRNKKLEST